MDTNFGRSGSGCNRYTFNYWHAYTADKYLNKNAEDSVLNVLTEDAGRFSIELLKLLNSVMM